jgi:AbrB family looped-hinge helix DNA binding protein
MTHTDSTHSLSVATVGTKGQIVIPLEVRERLGVGPGDKVVVMMRDKHVAVLLPMNNMRVWLDKMTADFDELKNVMSDPQNNKEERN